MNVNLQLPPLPKKKHNTKQTHTHMSDSDLLLVYDDVDPQMSETDTGADLDQAVSIFMVGVVIPLVLGLSGAVRNGPLACFSAALGLFGMGQLAKALPSDYGENAAVFATTCSRLFLLTAFGETAVYVNKYFTSGIKASAEMRMYECTVLLVCGFLVIGQVVEVLQVLIPVGTDSGTFLGIIVAGLSFSLRDVAACLISGLYENAQPHFKTGDTVQVDSFSGVVERKGLLSVRVRDAENSHVSRYVPSAMLIRNGFTVRRRSATEDARTIRTTAHGV